MSESHEIEFSVTCLDKPGMLGLITAAIGEKKININTMKAYSQPQGTSMCVFRVMVKNLGDLRDLFTEIRRLKGVERIERL
ncbi:ACT domain-containing protein [bacterium]|nr:ACT domain-containing protein [bacterium]